MKSGDVILKFDGSDVPDTRELVRKVANTAIGKTVPVVVFRDGKDQTLNVTLGKRAGNVDSTPPVSEGNGSPQAPQPQSTTILGMTVVPLTKDMRDQMGLGADLQGVVIKEAGQQKVTSVQDLQDRIQAAKDAGHKSVLLLIRRNGEPRFVALTLK
jgi:serine protease Do